VAGSQARLYSQLQRAYTDLRESQRAVMQQERLRALGQMASGVAHDINNSLTPIVTFADILLTQKFQLPEKARTYLSHIQTAGVDIGTIVSRLREFYRPRDHDEPHLPVDLHALLRQVAELTRPRWRDMPQARGAVINLQMEFARDVAMIAGNETELRESFINLMLNAVDAMPTGGTLTLRTRLQPAQNGGVNYVMAEVCDTGVGMDEETRARCLEPFFSTKGQLGTGLGLAMVYGVLERHAGRIEIESKRGAGTTMRLLFPARAGVPGRTELPVPEEKSRSLHILCVDDEPMLRNVLEELFRLDGHDVVMADGAAAGLELFRAESTNGTKFDVVVTDLGMPHMDGQEFAQAIKRESPDTPVVLLTGWGKIMKQEGELPAAVDAMLSKPPRLKELRSTLGELLGHKRTERR
jgi:nitrogen-specific signal transduction histidine kinase/ActR/RegA family two-component response regulator